MREYGVSLVNLLVGGLFGIAVHAFVTDSLFAKGDLQSPSSKTLEFINETEKRRAEAEIMYPSEPHYVIGFAAVANQQQVMVMDQNTGKCILSTP